MQLLRETAIGILNSTSPNYDAAREVIGQYLHLLQMFYSNTNWVEMNADKIYEPLGIIFAMTLNLQRAKLNKLMFVWYLLDVGK